jgi:BlaI family transcriptional regulator, penicillinase repressor
MKRMPTYPGREVPLPTDAELELLGVIWGQGRSTVGSVHFVLNEQRPRGYTTVLKLMQIMLAKGLLTRTDSERMHFYLPAVTGDETRAAQIQALAAKLFGGSLFALASFALGLAPADEDIAEIRAVLDAHDRHAGPPDG